MTRRASPTTSEAAFLAVVFCVGALAAFPAWAPAAESETNAGAAPTADEIRRLFDEGSYEPAMRALEVFAAADPESPDLPALRLAAARATRDVSRAVTLFEDVAARHPDHPLAARAMLDLAQLHKLRGDGHAAVRAARQLLERWARAAEAPEAYLLLADAHLASGRDRDAADAYAALIARFPEKDLARAQLGLAEARLRLGQADLARDLFKALLDTSPDGIDIGRVHYGMAQALEKLGDTPEAGRHYARVMRMMPGSFYALAASERLKDLAAARASRPEETPSPRREEYAVRAGHFAKDQAMAESARFARDGFETRLVPTQDGKMDLVIGGFSTRLQAEYFAEELAKKYDNRFDVVRLR
ncbi:tetratricopeptide repeat protein [bacterium]|nr:tetratricopeptide repeat protein [bacterium]